MKNFSNRTAILLCCLLLALVSCADWQKKTAPLTTKWYDTIDPANTWPEYPRPQMVRGNWVNLNGVWDLAKRNSATIGNYNASQTYNQAILVPFPIESALSGIQDTDYTNVNKSYVYRRRFEVGVAAESRVLLHFGAVDWETVVFVNGIKVGTHQGGYDRFTFDITDALTSGGGAQELVVQVWDPTEGGQPKGKQSFRPDGIWYTPSTGIWQTVWLEVVPDTYVSDFRITPQVEKGQVGVQVTLAGRDADSARVQVRVEVSDGGKVISTQTVDVSAEVVLPVPDAKLWSPDSPFLYNLTITLLRASTPIDTIQSYFAMRSITLGRAHSRPYALLNGKPIFQYGTLDQGFWPDGLYSPPSDEAMRFDIEATKELGFNTIRKHIKIEPDRWYYYCDVLGIIVWQDMPLSVVTEGTLGNSAYVRQQYYTESERHINILYNHPCILVWVPNNEGWSQFDNNQDHSAACVTLIRRLDSTRLIDQSSGWTDFPLGDIQDRHSYSLPALYTPSDNPPRASVCGETGGFGWEITNHAWRPSQNPYQSVTSAEELCVALEHLNDVAFDLTAQGGSGIIYTQITDVEGEVNGFYTYDRKVSKLENAHKTRFRAGIERLQKSYAVRTVVKGAETGLDSNSITWRYVTGNENYTPGTGWNTNSNFDDSAWRTGAAGFGGNDPPGATPRTAWTTPRIFLRRKTVLEAPINVSTLAALSYHDEAFEFYINGVLAASADGYIDGYGTFQLTDAGRAAIRVGQENLFAVRCTQTTGGQFIDVGLISLQVLNLE